MGSFANREMPPGPPRARAEGYVPVEHPLRRVRAILDALLGAVHEWLKTAGAKGARFPIGAEPMIRALLLQLLFAARRDGQLIDQIWFSVLFRWFVGVRADEPKWDPGAFSAVRHQLLQQDLVRQILVRALTEAHRANLLSANALNERRRELTQYSADVTVGVGQPGVLPRALRQDPRSATVLRAAYLHNPADAAAAAAGPKREPIGAR